MSRFSSVEAEILMIAELRRQERAEQPCEEKDCPKLAEEKDYCWEHYEHHFCECGMRLEDSAGQPGDGFCVVCR